MKTFQEGPVRALMDDTARWYRDAEARLLGSRIFGARLFRNSRATVLDDPPRWLLGRIRLIAWLLLVAGIVGFASVGAANATRPYLLPAAPTNGYTQAALLVSARTGTKAEARSVCVLVTTDTTGQPERLPGAASLDGATALLLVLSPPVNKPLQLATSSAALSIAWYSTTGTYIAGATVPPCPNKTRACPSYGPLRPYTFVVEARAGKLGGVGIGPGSTIAVGGTCSS